MVFKHALKVKMANLKKGQLTHKVWDKLVFNKIKHAIVGDRLRVMCTGAQPCNEEIFNTMRVIFSAPFCQIYGQTESIGVTFETSYEDFTSIDHVGGPNRMIEFKLVDRPEFNYLSTDVDAKNNPIPRGEIAVRGNQIFLGYYKNPEETAKSITPDGFLLTGDVGQLLPNGSIKILDRNKNVFKLLSGAEFICPESVENQYTALPLIENVFLYGDYLKNYCVAIVVPKKDPLMKLAQQLNVHGTYEEVCKNPQIYEHIRQILHEAGQGGKVRLHEEPKKLYIEPKTFAEQGLLTISMKTQRAKCRNQYKPIIDKLYEQN